ncbi:MAG: hypothetical protein A3C44_06540 [Gammaproteobacteria bacterium RIFCSPHIGHO2_02_FULL_39_13]|nr:MAG: hypothetical protein A3C44_06540 [Gammaproteobacteria bacterium RIFCSPHIGHO2_02_FULL_39_13]OGT49763.1 MAG: hypothetical protein A3E53_04675 [Gammaproteobacteria bacterium RIFCSPHIGHO2_12_FULL_39_24]
MGILNYFKHTIKDNTNVKGWTSWDSVKTGGKTVKDIISDMKPAEQDSAKKMTFDEAIKKYELTEQDLARQMRTHLLVSMMCFLLGIGAMGWTFYLLFQVMILSGFMSLSLSFLMLAYAFREHFYYFEIKQRRLDCTTKEWALHFFSKSKKN